MTNRENYVNVKVRFLYKFINNLQSKQNQKKIPQIVLETIGKILYKIWQEFMMPLLSWRSYKFLKQLFYWKLLLTLKVIPIILFKGKKCLWKNLLLFLQFLENSQKFIPTKSKVNREPQKFFLAKCLFPKQNTMNASSQ